MSTDTMKLACVDCGSTEFRQPHTPPEPEDIIECHGCGKTIGRYAEIEARAIELGKSTIDKLVEDRFGKKPTWR